MAGSRKALLKKISPHKGTGRYRQYIRCVCCGKLCRPQAIGSAGMHRLSVSRCVRKLPGFRTGWEWEHIPPNREQLAGLAEALHRALSQVEMELGVQPAEEFIPIRTKSVPIRSERSLVGKSQSNIRGEKNHAINQTVVKEERVRIPMHVNLL